jgi:hypothetical protein
MRGFWISPLKQISPDPSDPCLTGEGNRRQMHAYAVAIGPSDGTCLGPRYAGGMCAACALTAMAGASGARSWLQAHHASWLTEQRLKRATVGVFVVATIAGTTKMSGSSTPPQHLPAHSIPQVVATR